MVHSASLQSGRLAGAGARALQRERGRGAGRPGRAARRRLAGPPSQHRRAAHRGLDARPSDPCRVRSKPRPEVRASSFEQRPAPRRAAAASAVRAPRRSTTLSPMRIWRELPRPQAMVRPRVRRGAGPSGRADRASGRRTARFSPGPVPRGREGAAARPESGRSPIRPRRSASGRVRTAPATCRASRRRCRWRRTGNRPRRCSGGPGRCAVGREGQAFPGGGRHRDQTPTSRNAGASASASISKSWTIGKTAN